VFFIYTCGSKRRGYTKNITRAAQEKGANILGEYGCRGYDTFGPFKLLGGIAKGHPNEKDIEQAKKFFNSICN
jgi:flavodoxin